MSNVPEIKDEQKPITPASPQPQQAVESAHPGLGTDERETAESWETFIEQTSDEPPTAVLETQDKSSLTPHVVPPSQRPNEAEPTDDPPAPLPKPRTSQSAAPVAPSTISPAMRAVFITIFGIAGFVVLFALLFRFHPIDSGGSLAFAAAPHGESKHKAAKTKRHRAKLRTSLDALPDFEVTGIRLPGPWRVKSLEGTEGVRIIEGKVGKNPLVRTLSKKGVSAGQLYRVLAALKNFDRAQRPRRRDRFVIAYDKKHNEIKGFELITSPLDIYQVRRDDSGDLEGTKLDLKVAHREVLAGVRVGDDGIEQALKRARLDPSAAKVIDKAFDRRASTGSMPVGSTLRVILQETTALGRFARYDYVSAMEYHSAKSKRKPLRIYRFKEGKRFAYLDQRGHEPYRGGWRIPVPGAPITSPFNPKRMHPVLHIIRPHNGTDFGARTGTPVHATSFGVVDWAAPRGAAGNLVVIKHPGNIESYYMHLHHFAPGIKKGVKVETFQVIGFVGTTGRSTGPHLHFGIKRSGKWINPMSLKLDGDRLLPPSYRGRFKEEKAKWDAKLDSIELPPEHVDEPEPATGDEATDGDEEAKEATSEQTDDAKKSADENEDKAEKQQDDDDEELEPEGASDDEPLDDETP